MDRIAVIERQRAQLLTEIGRFIGKGESYALVDFPDHSNVGDSAIWLGEIELLKTLTGRPPSFVSTGSDFDPQVLAAAAPKGPIFLHGGGNFGDVWPHFQQGRFELMRAFPGRRLIQLPQSIKFSSQEMIADTAREIAAHGDFHLFVRDRASLDFAGERLKVQATLTPDCAMGLGPLTPSQPIERDILFLLRTDKEVSGADYGPLQGFPDALYCDWLGDPKNRAARAYRRLMWTLEGGFDPLARRRARFNRLARARFDRGMALIGGSRRVVTDRLHVHILSTLAGVPHVALDNNYGKISGYLQQWNADIDIVASARSAEEAVERLKTLPSRPVG